jgi:dihydroflavonol-4-reductase
MTETILLTGVSGFIAKHITLKLLGAGYTVRGSLRDLSRAGEVRAALAMHLPTPTLQNLHFVQLDLTKDDGWIDAVEGVAAVIHTASPFPSVQPKDEDTLLRPAVEGTLRVMAAARAAGVDRIILTSSTAAIVDTYKRGLQNETDWCEVDAPGTTAYAKSKTLAERAAWDFALAHKMALTTINPGFVLGAPLDRHYGASVSVIAQLMRGKERALPMIGFACVDVLDVAEAHLRALQLPQSAGRRVPCVAGMLSLPDMGRMLKSAYPKRKIPTRAAPMWKLRLRAMFNAETRALLPQIGQMHQVSNARARKDLDMRFNTVDAALRATADWLVEAGEV